MELLISIFENSSAKGSYGSNKISYEILQLSADSRYLQSGPLKSRPSFMLIGRLLSEIDHPPYFLYRIMCDPLLNLPEHFNPWMIAINKINK